MWFKPFAILLGVVLPLTAAVSNQTQVFDAACYGAPLPHLRHSKDTRPVPWGSPGMQLEDGTTCCNSIDEVRSRIAAVDTQILKLLAERAAYVREAGRFKSNRSSVFNQAANDVVVQRALNASATYHIPKTIAVQVYSTVLETMLAFEYCSFDSYKAGHS